MSLESSSSPQRPRPRTKPLPPYTQEEVVVVPVEARVDVVHGQTSGWIWIVVLIALLLGFAGGAFLGLAGWRASTGGTEERRPAPNVAATEAVLRQWVSASVAATLTAVSTRAAPSGVAMNSTRSQVTPFPTATAVGHEGASPEQTRRVTDTLGPTGTHTPEPSGGEIAANAQADSLTPTVIPSPSQMTATQTANIGSVPPIVTSPPTPTATSTPLPVNFDIVPSGINGIGRGLVEYTSQTITLTFQLTSTDDIPAQVQEIAVHAKYQFADRKQRGIPPQNSPGPFAVNHPIFLSLPFPSNVSRDSIGPAQLVLDFTLNSAEDVAAVSLRRDLGFMLCSASRALKTFAYYPVALAGVNGRNDTSTVGEIQKGTPVCLIGRSMCKDVESPIIKLVTIDSGSHAMQEGWVYLWEGPSAVEGSFVFAEEDVARLPFVEPVGSPACVSSKP